MFSHVNFTVFSVPHLLQKLKIADWEIFLGHIFFRFAIVLEFFGKVYWVILKGFFCLLYGCTVFRLIGRLQVSSHITQSWSFSKTCLIKLASIAHVSFVNCLVAFPAEIQCFVSFAVRAAGVFKIQAVLKFTRVKKWKRLFIAIRASCADADLFTFSVNAIDWSLLRK